MEVCIDSREQQRGKDAQKYYIEKHEDTAHIQEVLVGDYVFSEKEIVIDYGADDNEAVVFEVKKYSTDCINSMIENHLHNQAIYQFQTFKWHFIMIIGTSEELDEALAFHNDRFNVKRYYSAIASLNTFTTVLFAETEEEAFRMMRIQAVKCLDMKPLMKKTPRKTANPALNYLSNNIKGVGLETAEAIVERGQLHDLEDLLCLNTDWLMCVDGIGENRAELIMKGIKKEKGVKI